MGGNVAQPKASVVKVDSSNQFPAVTSATATHDVAQQLVLDLFKQGLPITHATEDVSFRKANAAIQAISSLDLLARKIIDAFLLIARPNMLENVLHSADIDYFKWLLSFNSQNHQHLKASITKIQQSLIQINIIDEKHPERDNWQSTPFFYDVGMVNGRIYFRIPESIRPALLDPKSFTYLSFRIKNRFSSQYAYILYERCRQAQFRGATEWWTLEEFRRVMNAADLYPQFQDLNKRVIKPAIEQINEYSDIWITPDYKTRGRMKTDVRFIIDVNPNVKKFLLDKENLPTELFNVLKDEFGFSNSQIDAVTEYSLDDLKEKIEFTRFRMKAGKRKIDRPDLYLMKALREDLRFNDAEKELFVTEKSVRGRKSVADKEVKDQVAEGNDLLAAVESMTKAEQAELLESFKLSEQYGAIKVFVTGKKFSLANPIVRAALGRFLQEEGAAST